MFYGRSEKSGGQVCNRTVNREKGYLPFVPIPIPTRLLQKEKNMKGKDKHKCYFTIIVHFYTYSNKFESPCFITKFEISHPHFQNPHRFHYGFDCVGLCC